MPGLSLINRVVSVSVEKKAKMNLKSGNLYVVATPIGNLEDITVRAVETLRSVDLICCEDTRHSARLMEHISSKVPMVSLHEHNERERSAQIIEKLTAGLSIALVSDAGTPLISDPGYVLVNQVIDAGFTVVPIPGVSAVITALSVSGLPTDKWRFEGFLPSKAGARKKALELVKTTNGTIVFYESSHRIADSLADMADVFGENRRVVVARELTKTFETVLRGNLNEVIDAVNADNNQRKGEFVVLVDGYREESVEVSDSRVLQLATELKPLMPPKKAATLISSVFGGPKKEYYQLLLSLESK